MTPFLTLGEWWLACANLSLILTTFVLSADRGRAKGFKDEVRPLKTL